jgi:hypothetical protein
MIIMRIYQANPIDGAASVKLQNRGLHTYTSISPWRASEMGIEWVVGKPNEESHRRLLKSYVRVSYSSPQWHTELNLQ